MSGKYTAGQAARRPGISYNGDMVYHGRVERGVVVFEGPVPLPDGTPVRVEAEAVVTTRLKAAGIVERVRGLLRTSPTAPTDAEVDQIRFDALAEKYGLDANPSGRQRRP